MTGVGRPIRTAAAVAALLAVLGSGCAALSNPVADAVPVRRLPPEAFGESRSDIRPVPLSALTPAPPDAYRLAGGDVLGVFVEGILGERGGQPPVRLSDTGNQPPAIGFPIPVRENGTVPLPLIDPLDVNGLTIDEAQERVRQAYIFPKKILKDADTARIIVTLIRPRSYHVLVLREDAGGTTIGTAGGFGTFGSQGVSVTQTRKAAGFPLDLPAYENDLLNALTRSGGLPGGEAEDEVLIQRGAYRTGPDGKAVLVPEAERQTLRVPLRVRPGEPFNVRPQDVVLQSGDIVQVRARIGDVFYTGGLLPSRTFPLPTDRDLDILEALALVGGPLINGGINANNLSGQLVQTGLGFPSPSQVTIIRKLPGGATLPILVNINRAFVDSRERIALRPGDFVVLQATMGEGIGQYLTSNLRLTTTYQLIRSRFFNTLGTYNAP
jgi:hypothetical protein